MIEALVNRRPSGQKRWWLLIVASLLAIGSEPGSGQPLIGPPPLALSDPRLGPLRTAALQWEARQGPDRQVVDQVCLVPDLATFFAAIARWDESQFYPILIEDAESTLRFLRAFHPARVVRMPPNRLPIAPGRVWSDALESVRKSWDKREEMTSDPAAEQRAAFPPLALGRTPPGIVLSNPAAPMLAGAVALAAGHFQPLVRFDFASEYGQTLSLDGFREFDSQLTATVARVTPLHLALGDDCDFLTIAGNYPYRYNDANREIAAVDDGLARTNGGVRWAYAGRLLSDPAASVYQAMCALFLQPDSATLFNGYDESAPPWSSFSTRGAALRLSGTMTTSNHAGLLHGTVAGWSDAFDSENRSNFVWINSHGSPSVFHLQNVPASTSDIPRTVPCSVVMVHSFSAADPTDPTTIAGRWLANGAFVYFGSINEPYLQAFRSPTLVVDLLVEHLPMAAALRNTTVEPFGGPWRLEYLGDPLYRLKPWRFGVLQNLPVQQPGVRPIGEAPGRIAADSVPASGIVLPSNAQAEETPESAVRSAVDAAFLWASAAGQTAHDSVLATTISRLSAVDRVQLSPQLQRVFDSILADLLFAARRRGELRSRIEAMPVVQRSPDLNRWLDAIRAGEFAWLLAGGDFNRIVAAWTRIMVSEDALGDFKQQATARVGTVANDPERQGEWAAALHEAITRYPQPAAAPAFLQAEWKRVRNAILLDRSSSRVIGRP